jgi:hypothetical protein
VKEGDKGHEGKKERKSKNKANGGFGFEQILETP